MGNGGCFLVLEGGEAVGKTTQWKRVAQRLEMAGHKVVSVREPGGTTCGDSIRDLLLNMNSDLLPNTESLLFAASRAQLIEQIVAPALAENHVVPGRPLSAVHLRLSRCGVEGCPWSL